MADDLRTLLLDTAAGGMTGLTLWRTAMGWQASLQVNREGWTVETRDGPAEALQAALDTPVRTDTILARVARDRATRLLERRMREN